MTANTLDLPPMPDTAALAARTRRRDVLRAVPGLTLLNDHEGGIALAEQFTAGFHVEAIDILRIELEISEGVSPRDDLEANSKLPGNVRHAVAHERPIVLAEVAMRDDAPDALRAEFEQARCGMLQAVGQHVEAAMPEPALSREVVTDALTQSHIPEEDVVDLGNEWEARTRWHEDAAVVRLQIDGSSLRCRRVLIKSVPPDNRALAHQALRFNAQLRRCRLALRQSQLVVEALLARGDVHPAGVEKVARAVAIAARHCRPALALLATESSLAEQYQDMFLNS